MSHRSAVVSAFVMLAVASGTPVSTARAAEVEATPEQIENAIDIAFGVALTSNYMFRGITQSDNKPAFQAYMEATYGIFYAGVWGSTVDFGDDNTAEIDLTGGIRPTFGNLSLDIGYARYFYTADGNCCGEGYVKAEYAVTEAFAVGGEIFHDFDAQATYLRASSSYALPQDFEVSGGFGGYVQFSQLDWDLGVSKTFGDVATVDVRYFGYNDDVETTHKVNVTLSLDTSLSALSGK